MAEKKKSKEEQIDIENISIEDGFAKLNELLGLMESEDVGLEGSFDLYKQGVDLVKVLNRSLIL